MTMTSSEFIQKTAEMLDTMGIKMKAKTLAEFMNDNEIKTKYNAPFKGGRGTHNCITSVFHEVENTNPSLAQKIANCFVADNGKPAWK